MVSLPKQVVGVSFLVLLSQQSFALDVSKEMCVQALSELQLPTEKYELKEGWTSTKHIFGKKTQCYEKGGAIYIRSGSDVYAEDGYFGAEALAARDKINSIRDEKEDVLRDERDEKIKVIRNEFKSAVRTLNEETEGQLTQVRENKIPTLISEGIIADRNLKESEAQAKKQQKADKKAKKLAEKAENERKGFHCLSGLSGAHRQVLSTVKSLLNDPKSFEHVETRVTAVTNGRHGFTMKYRAKNGFGGTIVGEAGGSYGHDDCNDIKFIKYE